MIIADDYGDRIQDDKVMLELLNAKKIDGVSILINYIQETSIDLITNRDRGMIGLHLDLNIDHIRSIFISRDAKKRLEKDIVKQISTFKKIFHNYPDFIDGHRHVHSYFNIQESYFLI